MERFLPIAAGLGAALGLGACQAGAVAPAPVVRSLGIYEAPAPKVDAAGVTAIAERLGVRGELMTGDADWFGIKQGSLTVRVAVKTGAIFYDDAASMWGANGAAPAAMPGGAAPASAEPVPDPAEARRIAEAFVRNHGFAGTDETAHYQDNAFNELTSGSDVSQVRQREVVFRRKLHGLTLLGPASQLAVFIGGDGKVVGAFVDWPTWSLVREVPIKSQDAAMQGLDAKIAAINAASPVASRITAFAPKEVALSFVGEVAADGTRRLLPTYAILGDATIRDTVAADRFVYLTASDEAPVGLVEL